MQLFNTLTRKLEHFTPQTPGEVTLYTCGPTVYDYQHIGNYSAYVRWDTLVRTLRESGYAVDWVMNITDVGHLVSDADEGEDKLQKGAKREGKTAWDVAKFYMDDFLLGLKALNVLTPTHVVRATDHIAEQIALIKTLEQKGYTYIIDDGVYFDTSKSPDYGYLARLDVKNLQAGARVEFNKQKRNVTDFALWKFTPAGQKRDMEWDSPWGKGFPGWHIECSVMAMKYLGETLDIHTGGIDHLPVHHINEIAQSEAATGKQFARFWLHCNHLMVEGSKISKSAGNGILLHNLAEQGFNALDVRMLLLQSHYRTQANFTMDGLRAARQRRLSLQAFADLRFQTVEAGELNAQSFTETHNVMLEELQNDLGTPDALAALSTLAESAQTYLVGSDAARAFADFVAFLDRVFGLKLGDSKDITVGQKQLITERETARAAKDFAKADTLRAELEAQKITVRDTPLGTIWARSD
ncbi:MAG TPA: cysteine--tRNA ligase [Candidatus Saccharimonas sp.]|nr:cysteine--tRNA ligase [Candidatus Saccharimonas sp.]